MCGRKLSGDKNMEGFNNRLLGCCQVVAMVVDMIYELVAR